MGGTWGGASLGISTGSSFPKYMLWGATTRSLQPGTTHSTSQTTRRGGTSSSRTENEGKCMCWLGWNRPGLVELFQLQQGGFVNGKRIPDNQLTFSLPLVLTNDLLVSTAKKANQESFSGPQTEILQTLSTISATHIDSWAGKFVFWTLVISRNRSL